MAKLIRTLVLLALFGGAAIFALNAMKKNRDSQSSTAGAAQTTPEQDKKKSKDAPIRTEEKYGFTSQGLGGGG